VRFFRTFLRVLIVATILVALVVALACVPAVQTWLVERAWAGRPGLHVSVESLSAGWSRVHVTNLRLRHDTGGLILPSLEATLPMTRALWDRQAHIGSVVAKGWTLDLSGPSALPAKTPRAAAASSSLDADLARHVTHAFHGLLRHWALPGDLTLDGADLEGDVLLPPLAGQEASRVRVTLKGGGMSSGRSGLFTLAVSGPLTDSLKSNGSASAHGQLTVAMDSPRSVQRVAFVGRVTSSGEPLPDDLTLSATIDAAGPAQAETYSLDLRRGTRRLIDLTAALVGDQRLIRGKWTLDLPAADVARFSPARALPELATTGAGAFDADLGFNRLHVVGHAQTALRRLGNLAPALDRLGAVSLESDFDLVRSGPSLQVDRLRLALRGARPIATAHSRQPFECDLTTGELKVADSTTDWLQGSLQGFPLAWLSGLVEDTAFAGGDFIGDFAVTAANGRFALHAKTPLIATGVSVQRSGRTLAQNLDLSLALLAERTPAGWQLEAAPLLITHAGRRLATLEAKLSPLAEPRVRHVLSGKWHADHDAWANQPFLAAIPTPLGRSSTGDFTIRTGLATEVTATTKLIGHTAEHSVTASLRAYLDAFGGVEFKVPLTVTFGSKQTNLSANGQWAKAKPGRHLDAELTGVEVELDHLSLLAGAVAAWGGVTLPALDRVSPAASPAPAATRDARPLWGDWIGRLKFNLYRLRTPTQEWNEVAGAFVLARTSLRLEGGRAVLAPPRPLPDRITRPGSRAEPPRNRLTAEGTLSFEAAAEEPHRLQATAALDAVDSARLFTAAQASRDPAIEGRFSVVATLTGTGVNVPQLLARRQETFQLASQSGVIRLLRSDVAPAITAHATPVKDTFTQAGALVGALFGIRKGAIDTGMNPLSQATQAVLDFSYQTPEIRYDHCTLTATRTADGPLRLTAIAITTPNEHLSGSGEIGHLPGRPLRAQPLSLDLILGFKGRSAQLLTTAGLLSTEKNEQGYAVLRQPIHLGGSLEKIDSSAWRDLLLKAAAATPDRPKKGG
jgi:hypothetical protein